MQTAGQHTFPATHINYFLFQNNRRGARQWCPKAAGGAAALSQGPCHEAVIERLLVWLPTTTQA